MASTGSDASRVSKVKSHEAPLAAEEDQDVVDISACKSNFSLDVQGQAS